MSDRKSVYDLERELKQQYLEDKYSPRMYQAIKNLAEKILVVKHIATTKEQVFTISHEYADYLYGKVVGGLEVSAWTKYIMLGLRTYTSKYWNSNRKVVIEVKDIVDQKKLVENCFSINSYTEADRVEMEEYLNTISLFILKRVLELSRYTDTLLNRQIYLSVLVSIFRDKVILLGVPEKLEYYVEFLVKVIRVNLYKDMRSVIKCDEDCTKLADMLSIDNLFNNY